MSHLVPHQYIERSSGEVLTERLLADRLIDLVYHRLREDARTLYRAFTSHRWSRLAARLSFDSWLSRRISGAERRLAAWGVDLEECMENPATLDTPRKLFERKIRYQECRPMPEDPHAVVSPADARVLLGSFRRDSLLCIKDKFFDFCELVGEGKTRWQRAFRDGDFALFRLTPDKYHYNHAPVSGRVVDFYHLEGACHSCNPSAVVTLVTPYSKNRRVVTVIDTDLPGGTGCGLVLMVEVVALMIGDIVQCYSQEAYDDPQPVQPGLALHRGQPKSLFRPGSSTVVLIFQPDRVAFDPDLWENQFRSGVHSRFALGFSGPLVETEVQVRSGLGQALPPQAGQERPWKN
ncbi:MAG: phosphatidylserine decarboxylase [Deltaproteobacteria bacterium]|nr:phosphatidylserine decarboxylase [Deltaproteobacteria bacterium]